MNLRPLAAPLLAALLTLGPAPGARAQVPAVTLRDVTSARAAGMGGAARGFASSGEALLVNPAGLAATTRFNLELSTAFWPDSGHLIGANAVDSKLNAEESLALSGGIGYWHYQSGAGDAQRKGSVVVVGLAAPLSESLVVGLAGRYLSLSGAVGSGAMTLDAGAIYKAAAMLWLSAVGYNLVNVNSAEAPRAWGFGLALGREDTLHLDFDVRIDKDAQGSWQPLYQAGAEYLIARAVAPRGGFVEDRLRGTRAVTGGLSVMFGGIALDGSYQKTLEAPGWTFGVALRLLDSPF